MIEPKEANNIGAGNVNNSKYPTAPPMTAIETLDALYKMCNQPPSIETYYCPFENPPHVEREDLEGDISFKMVFSGKARDILAWMKNSRAFDALVEEAVEYYIEWKSCYVAEVVKIEKS